ncbi:hypothetical protein ACLQ2E_21760 [Streptomyces lavendulocolor]
MTAARWATAAPPLLLLAATLVLVALLAAEGRRERRAQARAAERRARPHSAHVATAAQDAEELAVRDFRDALNAPCCPFWHASGGVVHGPTRCHADWFRR